jgi:DNA-binding MarR family transcriptional regulator/GNAT superfamily N-acetyltransferase
MPHSTIPGELGTQVAVFRRFNRFYTKFLGTLNEELLGSGYSLAEARILYELANHADSTAKDLVEELGLDAGYLSRILAKFKRDALIKKISSTKDARSAHLALTAGGKSAFRKLNTLSETQATAVFRQLSSTQRAEFTHSMSVIETILAPDRLPQLPHSIRTHRIGDMGTIIRAEALGYAEQFGWDETFEALVAKITSEFITNFQPERERCWIAEIDGRHAGHIFLVRHPEQKATAKLRLLFVDPSARGRGLGEILVKECVAFAHAAGYEKIVLWTQSILTSAHHIYARAGFRPVSESAHHSFGHALVGQEWELILPKAQPPTRRPKS